MRKGRVCLSMIVCVLPLLLSGVASAGQWAQVWGIQGSDELANSIQQTSDGGYIVAGVTNSFGAGGYDFLILKLDSSGHVTWQQTYGGTGDDWATSIQQTGDLRYIVAGTTSSIEAGHYDFWILKLDSHGTISVSPASMDYGGVPLGSTSDQEFIVTNTNTTTLHVSSTAIVNPGSTTGPTEFSIQGGVTASTSLQARRRP